MIIVEAPEVDSLLPMRDCIDLMREALAGLSDGTYTQPLRTVLTLPDGDLFGFMPANLGHSGYFGAKLVTAFHHNLELGLPSHRGYVMLFEGHSGGLVAMVEAGVVTRLRTGAVSALATELLSRPESRRLALIGAGVQARSHLEAISLVRDIQSVTVYDIDPGRAASFCEEAQRRQDIPVTAASSVGEAVAEADIICTLTPAALPYLSLDMVRPGTHINAVGAFSPGKRELCSDLVAASRLYADQVEAMKRECGEYLIPLREGLIGEDHIRGSIGDILLGTVPARTTADEITLFDALGLAVEDLACARRIYEMKIRGNPPA